MPKHASRLAVAAVLLASFALLGSAGTARAAEPLSVAREPDLTAKNLSSWEAASVPNRVWVYFTDKGFTDVSDLPQQLREAEARLTPKAKLRRSLRASLGPGSPLLNHDDLPVAPSYVEKLRALGLEVHQESRWLNAVSVYAAEATALPALRLAAELPFVRKLEPVRGGHSDRRDDLDLDAERRNAERRNAERNRSAEEHAAGDDYGLSYDQLEQIGVIEAHNNGWTGAGVWVAVFDTGFYHPHAAFADAVAEGRLIAQYDFVHNDGETMDEPDDFPGQHNHGTFTWSALGGYDPGTFSSPAPGASFILGKTEDLESETPVEEDNWIAAAEWADQLGADIISTSLSYILWYEYSDLDGDTAPITRAADRCAERGVVVVVSAGNQGTNDWYYIGTPADADSIVTVGAVDANNELAAFSSHGPTFDGRTKPEVVALGVDTYCAAPPNFGPEYWWISGTSLSCPLVAGSAALVLEANPSWTPMEVRAALMETADNAHNPDNDRGWGLIDVWAALNEAISVDDPVGPGDASPEAQPLTLRATPNPGGDRIRIQLSQQVPGPVRMRVYDLGGREIYAEDSFAQNLWEWSGRDDSGREVPAGVYLARVETTKGAPVVRLTIAR